VLLNLISNGSYDAAKCARNEAARRDESTLTVGTRELADAVEVLVRDDSVAGTYRDQG
jgi:hypothetical protein